MTNDIIKPKKIGRPRTKPQQMSIDFGDLNEETQQYVATVSKVKKKLKSKWRGTFAVPPASLLDDILREFQTKTNIPLEIPFFTFFHYVSALLVANDTKIKINDIDVKCDFWTIVLADSGAGKTFTHNSIKKGLRDDIPEISGTGAASAAAFLQELEQKNGKGLWVRDEFQQLLSQIESGGPLAELKDYLLRIYDNADIDRVTKKDEIHIKEACISILGFNATQSFIDNANAENLIDGFAQRFSYVLAEADPARHYKDFPIWEIDNKNWSQKWDKLKQNILAEYSPSVAGIRQFYKSFSDYVDEKIPESFYRRVLWKAHKYALIYHILNGNGADKEISESAYAWASRALSLHLHDAAVLIEKTGVCDIEKLIAKAEEVQKKMREQGKEFTARTLVQNVRGIKNVATAKFILEQLSVKF